MKQNETKEMWVFSVMEMKIVAALSLLEQVKILTWKVKKYAARVAVIAFEEHRCSRNASTSLFWMTVILWPLKCK